MENDTHLRHFKDILERRKFHFIIPFIVVFFGFAFTAFVLPKVYKAVATISIESQSVSQELLQSTVSGYVEERLQELSLKVLNESNLMQAIERFGLFTDLKDDNTSQRLVAEMGGNIQIEPITTQVISESGRTFPITTSFTVAFEGKEPEKLADVANHLAHLFLQENAKDREEQAQRTIRFLEKQLVGLRTEIQETEAKLAAFKEEHLSELPDLMELNLKTMDQLERGIDSQERHIRNLIERKIYLEGQLVLLEPTMYKVTADGKKILTPKEELSLLRSQYLTLTASLSEKHPDVIRLKKKLKALEGEVGNQQELRQLQSALYDKEHQLELLLKKVSPQHPDAVTLSKEVELLRSKIEGLSHEQRVLKVGNEKPENPAYINLQTRIHATQMEIEAAKMELKRFQERYEDYRIRVQNTPKVEQQYLDLQRNYANAQKNYEEISNRLRVALETKGLEEDRMAQKFSLAAPAVIPQEPYKPNRLAIVLLGLVLATGSGIGLGSISEYMDHCVYTTDELAKITGHKVLTVIPYWETSHEVTRKRRRIWVVVGSSVAIAAVALVALNLLFTP